MVTVTTKYGESCNPGGNVRSHGRGIWILALVVVGILVVYGSWRTGANNRVEFSLQLDNIPVLQEESKAQNDWGKCPVSSIASLSTDALKPKAGSRHMITPPAGGKLTLVCCETTKGHFSALLHQEWAPIGVAHLIEMIQNKYFSTKIPLFRCTDACQFGLSGDPNETKKYTGKLKDDPMWMPPGKDHRKNEQGVKRYPQGFWTYAGAGPNTRSNQFVITLKANPFMGGGSPWEVPLGEFVGNDSFDILPKIYSEYGEKGPSQKILHDEGNSERVQKEWPLIDYILGCNIVDEAMV